MSSSDDIMSAIMRKRLLARNGVHSSFSINNNNTTNPPPHTPEDHSAAAPDYVIDFESIPYRCDVVDSDVEEEQDEDHDFDYGERESVHSSIDDSCSIDSALNDNTIDFIEPDISSDSSDDPAVLANPHVPVVVHSMKIEVQLLFLLLKNAINVCH